MTQYALATYFSAVEQLSITVVAANNEKDAVIALLESDEFPPACIEEAKKVKTAENLLDTLSSLGFHVVVTAVPAVN